MTQNNVLSTTAGRITVLDALRGFALLGVILIHMLQHFSIPYSATDMREPLFPALDEAIQWLSQHVISGRFINIFAFLFGLSFFIQMDRAAVKGVDFRKRFIWRMAVLFALGLAGNCFYQGEILSIYALFGVILVFLYHVKNRILIIIVSLLLSGAPRIAQTAYQSFTQTEQADQRQPAASPRAGAGTGQTPEPPSFVHSVKYNFTTGLERKLNYQFGLFGRGYITLALFMLGLMAGRARFFEKIQNRGRRNLALLAGFVASTVLVDLIVQQFGPVNLWVLMRPGGEITPSLLAVMTLQGIGTVLSSGALVMGFILLYQTNRFGRYLDALSPYGRMGLTNYEWQAVAGCLLFSPWGFGATFGPMGTTALFITGIIIYTIQALLSRYWLARFLYGPFEWLWRSATYLKIQPLRRGVTAINKKRIEA